MITCHCTSHGCNENPKGRKQTSIVAQAHRAADRQLAEDKAKLSCEEAINSQELDLAAAVAALTLSGDATPSPSTDASCSSDDFTAHFSSLNISDTPKDYDAVQDSHLRRAQQDAALLEDLSSSITSLETASALHHSSGMSPDRKDSPFPLQAVIADVRILEVTVRKVSPTSMALQSRQKVLRNALAALEERLVLQQKCWNEAAALLPSLPQIPSHPNIYDADHHFLDVLFHADPLVQLSLFIMAGIRVVFHSSRDSCRWLLQMLSFLVFTAFKHRSGNATKSENHFSKTFPRDPDTVLKNLRLESKTIIFAVCPNPSCHKLYPPTSPDNDSRNRQYPDFCSYSKFSEDPPCGERLTETKVVNKVKITVPRKYFVFFDFHDWLAGLLSRPGYEDYLDAAWNRKDSDAPVSAIFNGNEEDSLKSLTKAKYRLKALEFVARQLCAPQVAGVKHAKKPYARALLAWRLSAVEQNSSSQAFCGFVLTPQEMKEIQKDIQNMITPSWLTSVPVNLGSASHGKLKADQWRVLGATYIPITLIRLWRGASSDARDLHCSQILEATITMLSAVLLATSRKTSEANAHHYRELLGRYIKQMRVLFPDYKFRPNLHMSMHLHQFILDFGPAHGWWTFPFERLIGLLERMPHNGKIGELEGTMTRAFNYAANLRGMLEKPQCPQIIRDCKAIFRKFADPHIRSTLLTDASTFASLFEEAQTENSTPSNDGWDEELAIPMPANLTRILAHHLPYPPPKRTILLRALPISGLRYTLPALHHGNSLVLVKSGPRSYAAQIESIVRFRSGTTVETRLIVRPFLPVDESKDIYSGYPILGAKMWKTEFGEVNVVEPRQIISHFACLNLNDEEMVAIDLSRVSFGLIKDLIWI
ncbi:hypothetical protein CVT24_006403 [Panaeolus cyanescens]|uniref:DUF4218 domain-containing protein n=1 Tax=Panaeolus cyanescens TaxID=181874 RepID=A0A409WVG5_9AGAR|nr:hypothetical protein CVT24_006403 [Panaeolus cyanescens]